MQTLATISKVTVQERIVYNRFHENLELREVDIITFSNGHKVTFDGFFSEVCNERYCSATEEMQMRKTTSVAKKIEFVNKYAAQFLSVGGRSK